ncbi:MULTISPECIES: signal peptide peptidase SppA [Hyphomicrobium]|jgi:protease-4|uniref:signal peptide peptidase SppA n=1 Tax=Hyphomicrobium TaxID=81 RepID=UPI000362CA96|nr:MULTISPECIES: signal peptide peptidase SppA [Hyphomicrobium]WBT38199.1 signal peptide peptidase SppA [Hyphomicrobium sp. DMF-1]HML43367.1 signal peptide peptidase SppA [Hyphomicrobium zavarzinii]
MSLETEAVLDRRRMRRRLAFWRSAAVLFVGLLLGALMFSSDDLSSLAGTHQIARVSIEGTITDDRDQIAMLKKIKDAKHVEALLVFVNSPGGTTTGGESLYLALRDVAEKKPVVAQFGTVAASAGYIVGLGTDHIVARGNTITGSVGVLAQWPEISEMLAKLGVKFNEVKSGELKAAPNPFEPASEGARRVMQDTIDDGFQWFLSLVETRRGIVARNVNGLVEGRIYSGRQALENKLVDEIGGESEAVRWLETSRGVSKDLKVVDWKPTPEGAWGKVTGSASQAAISALASVLSSVAHLATLTPAVGRVGLDGLVSVWQPSEN